MPQTIVYYYTLSNGENPARQFIDSHPISKPKIMRILHVIETYGLRTAIPHAIRRLKELLG